MWKITLFLLIFYGSNISAGSTTTEFADEAPGFGGAVNSLTDEEKILSENYVHEGLSQRSLDEKCVGDDKRACEGKSGEVFGDSWDTLAETAAKAYAMFMGGAGPKMDLRSAKPETQATSSAQAAPTDAASQPAGGAEGATKPEVDPEESLKDKERTDYCAYIPVATEAVSTAKQLVMQNEVEQLKYSNDTSQKDYLYKAAKVHKNRAATATIQTYGWGATTACYGAMYATGTTLGSTWWRFGAAGLLTTYFYMKKEAQEEYEKRVKAIADDMPGKGDCNPITQRSCYCSQPETENDIKYCLEAMKAQLASDLKLETCVNKSLENDPDCNCRDNNNCYSVTTMDLGKGWNLGTAFSNNVASPLKKLTNGKMTGAELETETKNNLAMAKKAMKQFDNKIPTTKNLNADQLKSAQNLLNMGISPNLARKMASLPLTDRASELKSQMISDTMYENHRKNSPTDDSNVFYIDGAKKNGPQIKKDEFDPYKLLKQKKEEKKHTPEVLEFSNLALERAQISSDPNENIFARISNRYKNSLWRQIELGSRKITK